MASAPLWSEIESNPQFSSLTPEQKIESLNKWTDETLQLTEDPAQQELVAAFADRKKRRLSGEELPETPLAEYLPVFREAKRLEAANQQGFLSQMGGALSTGLGETLTGVRGAFNAYTGDTADVAASLAESNRLAQEKALAKTSKDIAYEKELEQQATEFKNAQGFWPTAKELLDYLVITGKNPTAALKMGLSSAPNVLVSFGGQMAGSAIGALAGAATGPGAFASTLAGMVAGGAAINTALETQPQIYEKLLEATKGAAANMTAPEIEKVLQENPSIVTEGIKKGAIRGATIGLVESLFTKAAGRIVGAPQRAQAAAVSKWAASKGLPEGEALKTILRQNPELAKEAAEQAAIALRPFTKTGDVARLAGAGLAETLGEGAGEAAALKVTEGEIDPTAVYQETIGAGVVSSFTAGTLKILEKSGSAFGKLAKAGELVDRASQNNNAQGATEAALEVISQADQEATNKEQDELNQNESEQQLQLNLGNIEAPRSRQALAQVPGQQEFGFVSQADLGTAPRREAEGQMELPFGQAPATAAAAAQQLELPLRSEERGTGQMELGLNVPRNQLLPKQKATRTPRVAPQGQQLEMDFETPQDPFQTQTQPTNASQIQVQEAGRVPPVESQPPVQPSAVQAQEGTAQRQGEGQEKVVSRVSSGKPGGAVVETEFDFVEADELANLLQTEVNKDQTRDRKRNRASEEQITQIAADPDPYFLGDSPVSSIGAPVVETNAILAGNGRAAGLIRGYQGNTAGIQKYRESIQQKAAGMGRDISGMKNPVMIRRVRGYVAGDRRSFVTESNPKYSGLQETTTEAALLDAEALGDNLGSIEFNENGQLTSSSAQQVATKFAQAQRAVNATSSGKPDIAEATRRVQLAALALLAQKAKLDIGELTSFIETDIGKRTLSEVIRVAPSLTSLDTDLSLADSLLPALKVFNQGVMAVKNGAFANINEWNQNRANELVQEDITPEGNALVEAMVSAVRKPTALRDLFETYVERATSEQQKRQEAQQSDDIFGEARQNVLGNQILASVLQEAPEKAPELNLEPTPATEELPVQAEVPTAEAAPTVEEAAPAAEPAAESAPAVEEAAPAEEPSKQATFTRTQRDELNRVASDFLAQNGINLDAPLTKAKIEALKAFVDEYLASEMSANTSEKTRIAMEVLSANLGMESEDMPKAPKKPRAAAKPRTKREVSEQSREQAKAKREAASAKQKADLKDELAKALAAFSKANRNLSGASQMGGLAGAGQVISTGLGVAKVLAKMGIVKFSDFAAEMKTLLPDLWDSIKRYLSTIWEQLEASPRPRGAAPIEPISEEEANRIIAELDGKAAPATEEAPAAPAPAAEAPVEKEPPVSKPNLTEPVEKTVPADEPNVEVSNSEWSAKIGFGQSKNKSFREVFDEGNFNYLFSTLFSDEVLARASEKSRPEILRVRETVKKLPQYREYLADKAKTPAELKAERESLVEDYATALNTLKRLGMEATVDPETQEVIVTKPLSKTLQENAGKFGALYYDSNRAKYVGRNYAKLIDFAKRAATGSFEKSDSIRQEVWRTRQAVFDSVDMSAQTPAFTENSNPTTEKLLKMYTDAVANGFLSSKSAQSQMVDATMIDTAHANGKPMFLLGSEAGYGKTFVIGSAIDRILSRSDKPLRVVYVTKNQQLISQAKDDLKNHEKVGSIEFITYNEMGKMTDKTMPEADILVFDEAHTVRYNIQGDASSWAVTAGKLMAKASFSIVATATPYENIQQMRFLWPTGVFKPFQGKFLPTTENESLAEKGWFDFAIAAGAKATQMDRPNPSLKFESNAGEAKQDALFAREFLRKNGMFSFRASDIPSELVDMNFVAVEGAPEWKSLSEKVLQAFNYGKVGANAKAYMVNLLKRILEQSKLQQAVDLANKELTESDNSRIVIFTETRSKRDRDLSEIVAAYQEFKKTGVRDPKVAFPDIEEVIKAFDALTRLGVDKILFQSVQERFQKEFGDQAVFYTGEEEAGARKDAVEDWNAGKNRILIATMAAGGTGLSLHDKSKGGQFPRVQINVNLPWVGSEIEQVTRRTARTGMTSKAKIYWLFAKNILNEGQLAQTAGNRLHGLNLLVRGDISPSVEGIRNYQFNPIDGVTQTDDVLAPEDNPPSDTTEQNVNNAKAIQTETSRIERSIEPETQPAVTPEEFARGMRYVQSLINGARAMVIYDTLDNLLKRGDITAAEKSALREARTQAIYSNGRAIIATNRVRKSAQYKTPEQAAAAVVFHELMHGGSDILRNDPKYAQMYGEWVSMLNDNVTKGMLQSLVTRGGYSGFADWETNPTSKLRAMEEIFVRQVTSLYNRKGDLAFKEQSAFQRFKNWIRRLVNSVLGTNFQYGIDDAILSEWGRKFIVAISTSNLVFNTQQSIERFMGDVDVPVRPSGNDNLLSTFSEAEKERLYAYMEGNKSFSKLKQVLGLNGSGELGDVESLAPLREAAMREIGFSDTGSGPKVSTIATQNAIRIATELTNPSSNFGAAYQQRFGAESAATAVLQMELTKYALAMARKNDKRLLNLLKKNWNSIVLGSYTTATSSGRILNVRSRYVSEVLSTIDRMNEERSNLAGEALEQTGLTPEAANTLLRNINTLVAQAELDDSMREALFREIGQTVIREGENDSNSYAFIDVALESLDKDRQRKLLAILETLKQRAEIVKALRERGDSTIERSLDDEFSTAASYARMSTQELQALLAENDSFLNAAFASYENASNKQPIKRKNPPKPVRISAAAPTTLEQQLADNDRKLDQEIADYEDDDYDDLNEAEEAVKKNIDRLKAFIKKEHKAVNVPETVFMIISKVVKEAVANPENYSFSDFRDALEGELSQFDINPDLMEELVSTSYSAFARFPEKDAERLTKGLLEAARKKKIVTTPSDVAKLRSLVTEAVRNRDILGPDAFLSNFIPKVEALGVPTPQAKSLVEAAYQRSVQLRNEALQRKADRIKTALLDGSRNRFLDSIVGTPTPEQLLDIDWRRSTMLSLLTRSGLADIEAQRVLSAIDSNDITRILTKQVDPNLAKIASDRLNKVVESFTKKYEDDVKTLEAELKDPNKRRKRNLKLLSLKGLVKNQVRVPLDFDLFSAEAAKFGASRDQAAKLFDLAKQEAELSKMKTGKIPTKLGKVINYVLQNPTIRNNPDARMLALESFLRDNGYDEGQIKDALSSFKGIFDKYIKMAKEKAMTDYVNSLDKARVRKEKVAAQKAKYVGDITEMSDSAYNQLKSDLELIRKGLASSEIDPDQTLAKKLGFDGFLEGDERSLAELDLKITNAMADGRAHDMAEGLRELYELISRRKAPKRLREVIAITMNNNALSGPSTIMVNVMSPLGSFITRVIIDIGKSIATGDMRKAWLSASIAFDSLKKAMSEIAYGLRDGGASTVAMNQQVQRVTTLQGDVAKASITMRDKKAPKWARLKATYIYASGFTDIVRRLLSTLDHTAFAVFQNYFLRTNTATLLEKVGKTKEEMVPVLFANSERARSLIANENALINRVASALQSVNYSKNESLAAIDAIMAEDSGTTNRDYLNFKSDFLGAVRRTVNAYNDSIQKFTTREIRRQQNMVYLRANDRTNRDMLDALSNSFSSSEDGQGAVEDLRRFTQNESEYELGVHLGEEAPGLDVINLAVNSIREAGQYVVQKNPIFGRMLLGYFGIPANLLNRAMWYTPYGLLRLAINRFANGKGKFYQQSMQTQAQIRQRVTETLIGTAGIALILGIKAMGEDDDEGFNVTLNGPTNKTERDAWRKNGHKENSLEYVTKDGTVVSVNWGRGFLESFKVALLMVGVVDDLKLNRKIGEDAKAAAIGDYLAAFMYGWSKQAAFFGAKSTIGAVATPQADASLIGTALYKTNPLLPFSGLVAGIEKMIAGPDLYRGGNNAPLYLNIPIARSLFSERAVNALGDPQGLVPNDAWTKLNDRAWYAGIPIMVSGSPTGRDKAIYDFILARGTGPGLPQRTDLEATNGGMDDNVWLDYVAYRGSLIKNQMFRELSRLNRMDDDALVTALSRISNDATKKAKQQFRFK